jgi:hypothetical protein
MCRTCAVTRQIFVSSRRTINVTRREISSFDDSFAVFDESMDVSGCIFGATGKSIQATDPSIGVSCDLFAVIGKPGDAFDKLERKFTRSCRESGEANAAAGRGGEANRDYPCVFEQRCAASNRSNCAADQLNAVTRELAHATDQRRLFSRKRHGRFGRLWRGDGGTAGYLY